MSDPADTATSSPREETTSSSHPETASGPVITELEGFPDPVRDPDTGMIIPQSRKERRALEAAQAAAAASSTVAEPPAPPEQVPPAVAAAPLVSRIPGTGSGAAIDPRGGRAALGIDLTDEGAQAALDSPLELPAAEEPKKSRAGRNLPAAIITGVILLGTAIVGLLYVHLVLVVLIVVLLLMGTWEIARALRPRGIDVPLAPLWVASAAMPLTAYFGGIDAMMFALFGTMLLALYWCVVESSTTPVGTVLSAMLILLWVPFLLSFGVVLLHEPQGSLMVASLLLIVVANDTGGYVVGVLFGKHPMAPKVSPKKSWEGLMGSLVAAMAVGAGCFHWALHEPWWIGALLGFAIVFAATAGDFSESMVKRELDIKDMGNSLPGHGGAMDRLDSLVFAAPVAYTVFVVLMP